MGSSITIRDKSLCDVFKPGLTYLVPPYQHPYFWLPDLADALFDDLYNFHTTRKEGDDYFLGNIVLRKNEDTDLIEVIDGQNRLTTLIILYAVLASRLTGNNRARVLKRVMVDADPDKHCINQLRLILSNPAENDLLKKYIYGINNETLMKTGKDCPKSLFGQSLLVRSELLLSKVEKNLKTKKEVLDFVKTLDRNCLVGFITTKTLSSATRILSVLDTPGSNLLVTDILKAKLLEAMPEEFDKSSYSIRWEQMEKELGRNGFCDLFNKMLMIRKKEKAKRGLLEELEDYVLPQLNSETAKNFIDGFLRNSFYAYKYSKYPENGSYLQWLNRNNKNSDWIPVAMQFYMKNSNTKQKGLRERFYKKLDELACYMRLFHTFESIRIERYSKVLKELESLAEGKIGKSVGLTEDEKRYFKDRWFFPPDASDADLSRFFASKRHKPIRGHKLTLKGWP